MTRAIINALTQFGERTLSLFATPATATQWLRQTEGVPTRFEVALFRGRGFDDGGLGASCFAGELPPRP
jgi:hypothetical protein